jgi:Tol biopolymer transport system component
VIRGEQVTFEGDNRNPVFSPDGTHVVFSSDREGTDRADLFVKDLDDDLLERSVITLEGSQTPTQWPSDSLIVFEQGVRGSQQVWTVNLSDPANARVEPYLSPEADLSRLVVSPDGTLAAYVSSESGRNAVYIRSFPDPGAPTRVSEGGGVGPSWSPDGNTVYYWTVHKGRNRRRSRESTGPVHGRPPPAQSDTSGQ